MQSPAFTVTITTRTNRFIISNAQGQPRTYPTYHAALDAARADVHLEDVLTITIAQRAAGQAVGRVPLW